MRITREGLVKIAEDAVERAVRANRNLAAAYMYGAVNDDKVDPLVGGVADIDLVFVHDFEPPAEHEVIQINDDVHLDIVHHIRSRYRQPREMRTDPFLGYAVYYCRILHDPRHLMDFAQAGVRAQFSRADTVFQRVTRQIEEARQAWAILQGPETTVTPGNVLAYLDALYKGSNAVVGLSGPPLSLRRFMLEYPARTAALAKPGLAAGLAGLLSSSKPDPSKLRAWLPSWDVVYDQAIKDSPEHPDLKQARKTYYRRAIDALLENQQPAALWILLYTWTRNIHTLVDAPLLAETWYMLLELLGLGEDLAFREKTRGLDAYLETVEDIIAEWAHARGVD